MYYDADQRPSHAPNNSRQAGADGGGNNLPLYTAAKW